MRTSISLAPREQCNAHLAQKSVKIKGREESSSETSDIYSDAKERRDDTSRLVSIGFIRPSSVRAESVHERAHVPRIEQSDATKRCLSINFCRLIYLSNPQSRAE